MLVRTELAGAVDERLFFAQVREDPVLEIEALKEVFDEPIVIVSSGGCTALSLLACGAHRVVGVDLNRTQNHLVELKAAALRGFGPESATAFLGGTVDNPEARRRDYEQLRPELTLGARRYWDARGDMVAAGVLGAGVTERMLVGVGRFVQTCVHSRRISDRLLALQSLDEQREFYARVWNTKRWRATFRMLLNQFMFRKTYDPAFFDNAEDATFASHFHRVFEHAVTQLPVRDNYFLHFLFTGRYDRRALPPYLSTAPAGVLELVDGSFSDYLKTLPDNSIGGFALSNILEWLAPASIDELLTEIVRTAKPNARLVFRNFVGMTEVPVHWRAQIIEDPARGADLIRLDRSFSQRRIAVCAIDKEAR